MGKDFSSKAFIETLKIKIRAVPKTYEWPKRLIKCVRQQWAVPLWAASFGGKILKREHMIHFFYKWLLWKRRYIFKMNTFRNSFRKLRDLLPLPHAVSLFGFCCVCAHVELRFECECKCRIVLLFIMIHIHV